MLNSLNEYCTIQTSWLNVAIIIQQIGEMGTKFRFCIRLISINAGGKVHIQMGAGLFIAINQLEFSWLCLFRVSDCESVSTYRITLFLYYASVSKTDSNKTIIAIENKTCIVCLCQNCWTAQRWHIQKQFWHI